MFDDAKPDGTNNDSYYDYDRMMRGGIDSVLAGGGSQRFALLNLLAAARKDVTAVLDAAKADPRRGDPPTVKATFRRFIQTIDNVTTVGAVADKDAAMRCAKIAWLSYNSYHFGAMGDPDVLWNIARDETVKAHLWAVAAIGGQ
jgi:hypothetical protein